MAEPWQHALCLDRAVREWGLERAPIDPQDYEGVKPYIRRIWTTYSKEELRGEVRLSGGTLVPARVLLAYFKGHFLYREVPENDQALWPDFLEELGFPHKTPKREEYDRLWDVLSWHGETRDHLRYHPSGDRDFLGTLDSIFHFRAQRLRDLEEGFKRFFLEGKKPEREPFPGFYQKLKEAMELLLDAPEGLDLCDREAVLAFLEGSGLRIRHPHPVLLLFHRSEKALERLWLHLKGKGRESQGRSTVRVEFLEAPPGDVRVRPLPPEAPPLLEGWRVHGEVALEDGRFRRFTWVPRCTPEGNPLPEEVEVAFPEGERVRFRLHHRAWAVRASQAEWVPGRPFEVRTLGFDRAKHPLRFFLDTGEGPEEDPERLVPYLQGESQALYVEVRLDGRAEVWQLLARFPIRVDPKIRVEEEPAGLRLFVYPNRFPLVYQLWAGGTLLEERRVTPGPQGHLVPAGLVPLEVRVVGWPEPFPLPPKGLEAWWRRGLGWGSLANREA
ncbi:hypothetical protein Theos_2274 (plasmid) [Thermus oshimai JL-2]|uniref:Uncharacterized protein n=1 Tax=Thermus oshimai JL-2 TaxID=751945 RepID=K7QYX5_THEOS|nr:hypothetical protein [Thermus oshimai]AFV77263.1 hypothetical protein Theos_2274 [Thermus oshimai JL-2]